MLLTCCLPLTNTLCTGRGNHQVSPPPTGPSGCCCGVHLVQTFKAQMPGGVPVDLATDRGLGATRVSGMLLPRCCPVLQRRHWRPSVSGLDPPPPPLPALTHVRTEPITVTVPRPPQPRVTDIRTK